MLLLGDQVEPIVMRESIRARVSVAPISVLATFLAIFLYIPFLVYQGVPYGRLTLWAGPIILLMVARGLLSRRIRNQLDEYTDLELGKADQALRISSLVNQITVGMGIWIVQSPTADLYVVPLFMTLIVVIWSIGVLANLFSDYRTFIISMPFLIGEPAVFWLFHGDFGISIGLSMALAAILMVLLVRHGTAIFRESVLMRFEKDQLLKKVEIERQKTQIALDEAQAANDSKTYFMAAASHDIKQPLYALGILTDTLLMSDPPKSTVPILKAQRDSISQMSEHFDALMDLERYQGNSFELNLTRIQLREFSVRIASEIAPLCEEKCLTWNLDFDDAVVTTDSELLLRLFRNLLTNAVRHTDFGEICCSARTVGNFVEFVVSDTGSGIPAEHQQEVFREFVRLEIDGARSTGAGIGLSIVEKINQALELDLKMSSTLGEGTRFNFRISATSG